MNLEPSAWRRRTQSSKAVATSASASVWWYVTVCIALGGLLVESQGLQAIPPRLYVKNLSKNVNLLCKSDKPIEDCSVKIPGYLQWSTADDSGLPSGIGPYGDGWSKGECGVRFMVVKSANEGKFFCNVTVGGQVFQQSIDIMLTVTPEPTEIEIGKDTEISKGGYRENQTLTARCISQDGVPMSNLSWYLDDDLLDSSLLGEIQLKNRTDNRGKTLVTVEQELRYFLTAQDNGKRIICRASHFAIGKGFYRAFLPLNIHFAPLPTPTVDIRDSPNEMINVTIKANPRPSTSWYVKGQTIEEGLTNGPYQAYIPKDLGNGNFQVILKINEPTEQTELIELQATNGLGSRTYVIKGSKYLENEIPDDDVDDVDEKGRNGAVFWLISIWTFCTSVIFTCLLR
uniref:Fasciclin-3 n=1 Tax=Culex pipiens TaxID=7175 RepID=A0A8D8CWW7_CULPI